MIDTQITIISLSLFVLMTFSLFVFIRYAMTNKFLYITVPFILILSISTYNSIQNLLGYPVHADISKEYLYLGHVVGEEKKWIYFWAIDLTGDKIPKGYRVTYTKDIEKKASESKKKSGEGMPQGIIISTAEGNESTEDSVQLFNYDKMKGVTKDE